MEKIVEQGFLYDFYGELLTEHQRKLYEDAIYNDLSLSEIAEQQGISRQGVHDLIKRCDKILAGYESKLHLVRRFTSMKEKIGEISTLTDKLKMPGASPEIKHDLMRIKQLSEEILEEL